MEMAGCVEETNPLVEAVWETLGRLLRGLLRDCCEVGRRESSHDQSPSRRTERQQIGQETASGIIPPFDPGTLSAECRKPCQPSVIICRELFRSDCRDQ
jgi:hypothetical protein